MPLVDYYSVHTLKKVSAFLQIAIFSFLAQRNPYTAHNLGLKQCTAKRKIMSENIITDQPEELAEILTVSTSNSFQFSLVLVF